VIDQAKAPERAAVSFYRALQFESELKKDPVIHALLAIAYDTSAWEAASRRYKSLDNAAQPDRDTALRTLFATTDRLLVYTFKRWPDRDRPGQQAGAGDGIGAVGSVVQVPAQNSTAGRVLERGGRDCSRSGGAGSISPPPRRDGPMLGTGRTNRCNKMARNSNKVLRNRTAAAGGS
jgi:hypothetical protein